jgi:hypothetical protein
MLISVSSQPVKTRHEIRKTEKSHGPSWSPLKIEQLSQKGFILFALMAVVAPLILPGTIGIGFTIPKPSLLFGGTFDDLVQLAAIQPHAAACRAIVDLDSLTISDHQVDIFADRTLHFKPPFS